MHSNSNSPNLLLWFFCLIKSRANRSGITQPFLNPNLIFFSKAPQIVCPRIIKKNQNKDLENSTLEVPMSRTCYRIRFNFGNAENIFDWSRKQLFTSEFNLMNHSSLYVQNVLAFLRSKLDFQTSNWEFRSFEHDWFQARHLPKSLFAIFLFH